MSIPVSFQTAITALQVDRDMYDNILYQLHIYGEFKTAEGGQR